MDRGDTLAPHKLVFARKDNNGLQLPTINSVIDHVKPTALIGLSTQGGVFTPDIIRKMAEINTRPIIMPLSNPLKNAECTFDTAMRETEGRVLFASGTAFPAYTDPKTGKVSRPGQGNNMWGSSLGSW